MVIQLPKSGTEDKVNNKTKSTQRIGRKPNKDACLEREGIAIIHTRAIYDSRTSGMMAGSNF